MNYLTDKRTIIIISVILLLFFGKKIIDKIEDRSTTTTTGDKFNAKAEAARLYNVIEDNLALPSEKEQVINRYVSNFDENQFKKIYNTFNKKYCNAGETLRTWINGEYWISETINLANNRFDLYGMV